MILGRSSRLTRLRYGYTSFQKAGPVGQAGPAGGGRLYLIRRYGGER